MKKAVVILFVFLIISLSACQFNGGVNASDAEFLRIHIRANSNEIADQNVKYAVKTAVVDYLTPYLAQARTKQDAMAIVESHLTQIQLIADKVLCQNGFLYQSNAELCNEEFPTRSYDGVVLESGVYDALIVNLGTGTGDNWWCVVYPPLCFVPSGDEGNSNVVFRWRILEIIQNWKRSR